MSISRKELRLVVDTYKFYYEKVSKIENYIFKMTDSRAVMIDNFVNEFKNFNQTPILQETSLKKFFDFQFNHWYKRDGKFGKGVSIQIEWIIGKQAVERYKSVNKKHMSFIVRKNLKADNDFTTTDVKKENWNELLININQTEEFNKAKFINKSIGFENCLLTTNLYNHRSSNCLVCKFSTDCKNKLKILYPKIHKIRGY
jgi:hypothetical protein